MKNLVFFTTLLITNVVNTLAQQSPNNNYKEVKLSSKRAEIVLNNQWLFQPAIDAAAANPVASNWANIKVPSSWTSKGVVSSAKTNLEELSKPGTKPMC